LGIGIENRDAIIEYSLFEVTKAEAWLPGHVGDGAEDLPGLEVAQVDAGDAAVHLVHEQPAPVVIAVGLGEGGMVDVTPREPAQHGLGLVVEAVAGGGVGREHGDGGEMAHGGDAVDVDLPGVSAGREQVVLVEVAGAM
jgi:hypothetical protein